LGKSRNLILIALAVLISLGVFYFGPRLFKKSDEKEASVSSDAKKSDETVADAKTTNVLKDERFGVTFPKGNISSSPAISQDTEEGQIKTLDAKSLSALDKPLQGHLIGEVIDLSETTPLTTISLEVRSFHGFIQSAAEEKEEKIALQTLILPTGCIVDAILPQFMRDKVTLKKGNLIEAQIMFMPLQNKGRVEIMGIKSVKNNSS